METGLAIALYIISVSQSLTVTARLSAFDKISVKDVKFVPYCLHLSMFSLSPMYAWYVIACVHLEAVANIAIISSDLVLPRSHISGPFQYTEGNPPLANEYMFIPTSCLLKLKDMAAYPAPFNIFIAFAFCNRLCVYTMVSHAHRETTRAAYMAPFNIAYILVLMTGYEYSKTWARIDV